MEPTLRLKLVIWSASSRGTPDVDACKGAKVLGADNRLCTAILSVDEGLIQPPQTFR